MGAQLAARIPAHTRDLNTAGLSNVRAMTAAEISEYVRAAFHPGAAAEIDEKRANGESAGVAWEDAGPVAAYPGWDYYRHDDGISVTCEMVEPPQGVVESTILEPVLKPSTLIPRKRVTFIYRTHDPAEAPRIADRDRRAAFGRATQRGGEGKAHEEAQLEVARKTARDQQHGAGLTRVAVLATATVTNVEDFSTAGDTLMQLAQESQLLVRPCYRVQDSAFTAALGVGVVLSEHTTLGGAWEEWK